MEQMSSSEYEDHVAAVLADKFKGMGAVERDVRLKSRSGVRDRQIDVLVRVALPGMDDFLIVVDTKRYSEPVDAKDVEAFIGLVSDVGAEMGLLVTNRGFTQGARNRVTSERGIRLDVVPIDELEEWEPPLISCRACAEAVGEDSLPGMVWLDDTGEIDLDEDWGTTEVTLGTCDRCGSVHIVCPRCETLIVPAEWPEDDWLECDGGCGLSWMRRRMMIKDDLSNPEHSRITFRLP